MSKDKEVSRSDIQRHVDEYLAKGGQIEKATSRRKAPRKQKWISRRGHDYTPWRKL